MEDLLNILVVDDDFSDFSRLRDLLQRSLLNPVRIFQASNATDATDIVERESITLCFVAYTFSGQSGLDLIAELSVSKLPCILLTHVSNPEVGREARRSGACEYLPKSDLNETLLERCVRYVLKHAKQSDELIEERLRFERVLQESPFPIILYEESGQIRLVNNEFSTLTGYNGEMIQTIQDCATLLMPEIEQDMAKEVVFSPNTCNRSVTIRSLNGDLRLWQFKTVQVGAAQDGVGLYVTMAADVTRLTSALHHAEAANRAKSEFLSVVSHELRTPLNPIVGLTQILIEEVENREHAGMLKMIADSGQNLHRLIADVLDYSGLDSTHLEIVDEPFTLLEVVERSISDVSFIYENRGLALSTDWSECDAQFKQVSFVGDSDRICQILMNFLKNALKFTRRGHVTLRVGCEPAELSRQANVTFEVEDTGLGISLDEQAKIFHPLYQVDSSSTRLQNGTGLGLAICKKLATAMQFDIGVRSQFGQGATFYISGQLEHSAIESMLPQDSQNGAPVTRGKLLVVEDEQTNRIYVRQVLQREGLELVEANDGVEAIARFKENPEGFALILMDLSMPNCNGYDATVLIRDMNQMGKNIPIIALTANASREDELATRAAGMNDFLSKPFRPDQLVNLLTKWMPAV